MRASSRSLTGATLPVDAPRIVSRILTYGDADHATLDATIREFALLDEQPDAIGALTADLGPFEARAFVAIRQTDTVGTKPIRPSGGFLVTRHFMPNYGLWQTDDPAADKLGRYRRFRY